jgi:hypothetical protein
MLDLNIDTLSLHVTGAQGQEHRIRPIATRAAAILAERLDERVDQFEPGLEARAGADRLQGPRADFNLGQMNDEQAAQRIAASWLEALTLYMR